MGGHLGGRLSSMVPGPSRAAMAMAMAMAMAIAIYSHIPRGSPWDPMGSPWDIAIIATPMGYSLYRKIESFQNFSKIEI